MSKRPFDTNQNKMSRNDRFAQMSQQEMLIEQKKREIQAKLEAKRRQNNQEPKEKEAKTNIVVPPPSKDTGTNQYSNDGSFLNQFKQLKDKKKDSKFKTFNKYKDREREREKEREKEKEKEKEENNGQDKGANNDRKNWPTHRRSPSPLDRHRRSSRFSADRSSSFEPQKITFNTSFSNSNSFPSSQPPPNPQIASTVQPILQQSDSLLGPQPSTPQIAPISSDSFSASANVNFAPPVNTFAPEIINFTSQSQIITITPPADQNLVSTPQLVTTTVTQPLAPPSIVPPLMQQPVGIIAPPGQEIATPNAQISAVNLSNTAPSIQQSQPIISQALPPSNQIFTTGADQIISGPPQVLMNVPPPQIVQQTQLILTPQTQSVLMTTPTSILTTVTLPPPVISPQNLNVAVQNTLNLRPPGLAPIELTSIPPPNPIQVQNIPQPEPLNTMNIPPPAPLQVQNIPTPSSLQLNEIPNPKPIDLMAIPTPNEGGDVSDADFIKNVPPPNKSVPPPNLPEVSTAVPPPNSMNFLNNRPQNASNQMPSQGMRMHNIGPSGGPIHGPQGPPMQVTGPPSLPPVSQAPPSTSRIPSLMSQQVLPPPGMGVNVPPPLLHLPPARDVSQPPPNFINQAPPRLANPMPNLNVPPPLMGGASGVPPRGGFKEEMAGGAEFEAMANLARMVADCGPSVEDVVRLKKNRDPDLWFLFHKDSAAYRQYANLVEQYKREKEETEETDLEETKPDPSDIYEPEMALEDDEIEQEIQDEEDTDMEVKQEVKQENEFELYASESSAIRRERKRKSRWGEKDANVKPPGVIPVVIPTIITLPKVLGGSTMISKVTRNDPGLVQYAMQTYGSTNLSDEDWKKAEDNYKIHLLYQDMMKKREELQRLEMQGKKKYEYDSDEDTDGGTWEHKLRVKEMQATERWAQELTRQAEGKHHIGDFLPPEELNRFMEKSNAVKEGRQPNFSDYKEFKIKEDNIGFQMLQKLGWTEGQGLGQNNTGIVEPVNKGAPRENTQGLGLNLGEATEGEDEYESYRKRMMLAYRFRPNPLNNPRRPYY